MRVIIVAIGSAGDVHPLLGLADSFARSGHDVAFCTNSVFAQAVIARGHRFLPLGTREQYESAVSDPALWRARTSFRVLWRAVAQFIRPLYDLLVPELGGDTVVIGSLWALGARLVQEKHQVPYVSAQISPSTILSADAPPVHRGFTVPSWLPRPLRHGAMRAVERGFLDRVCGPALNDVRAQLGLPPVTRVLGQWVHSPDLVLGLFPAWFAPPRPDWPQQIELTGFPLFDGADQHGHDAGLAEFLAGGPPPVVVTAGSTATAGTGYLATVAAALRTLGQRAVVLTGQRLPATRDVLYRPYAPLTTLLPHARAIVHHGGIGTAAHAFAAGVPQLVTPFAHDQFDNAARVARSGCGIRFDASSLSVGRVTRALSRLLSDHQVARCCAEARELTVTGDAARQAAVAKVREITMHPIADGTFRTEVGRRDGEGRSA